MVYTLHTGTLRLYLGHVNRSHSEGLVAQDGSVLVSLPSLQHDLQLVAFPF